MGFLIGRPQQLVEDSKTTDEVEVKALDGYRFIGWDDGFIGNIRSDTIYSNKIFIAQFEKTYTLTIIAGNSNYGFIEGETKQVLVKGEISSKVMAVPFFGYKLKSWSNGFTKESITLSISEDTVICANFMIDYMDLPVIEINTDGSAPINSKYDYVSCNVSVSNTLYEYTFESIRAKIRGRGNITWDKPKNPFKLKFENKINLFGNGEAKTWNIIANYFDPSLLRNYIAYQVGSLVGSDYVTTVQFVELFINGEYLGVYLVCKQNEADIQRVAIEKKYTGVDKSFLLELDCRAVDDGKNDWDYFEIDGIKYSIKFPDTEDEQYDEEYLNYIKNFLSDASNALLSENIGIISNYIDISSFAKSYIVHELFKSMDVGQSSFFIYKDVNGLLKTGPIWDFDDSSGNFDYINDNFVGYQSINVDTLWACAANFWYYKLVNIVDFRNEISNILINNYNAIIELIDSLIENSNYISNSVHRNYEKWQTLGTYVWPNPPELVSINTWEGQVEYFRTWLLRSLDYMYNYYVDCSQDAYSITINSGEKHSIDIFNTNDLKSPTTVLTNAWSRDGSTGELLNDGNGQIIFRVNLSDGYKVKNIFINDDIKYLLLEIIDDKKYIYKITGISGDIEVDVELEEDIPEDPVLTTYNISFVIDSNVSIMVYEGKDYSIDGTITNSYELSAISGDGQVNFKVILEEGYIVDSINITGGYNALKGPSDTGAENVYRITKVTSDLVVTMCVNMA